MKSDKLKKHSKFLSLVLRHKPETINLKLDENGWAHVDELLKQLNASGRRIDFELLQRIVAENDKKRFAFSTDQKKIRANQGHSLAIELNLQPQTPPAILYHGTAQRNIASILQNGLEKRNRQHVHLSTLMETAISVGSRYGRPVVLHIAAQQMHLAGHKFYLSDNQVWLTDHVPVHYISQEGEVEIS